MLLRVTLGESDALYVALTLWLIEWEADRVEVDVVERESVDVELTLALNDMLAESEVDEVPLSVRETDSVGVTVNINDGDVVIVVVLLGAMLLVALIDMLPVVDVLGEWESLSVSLGVGLVVELAVYDGVAETLFVALSDTLVEVVDVELALEDVDMDTDTEYDWLSL